MQKGMDELFAELQVRWLKKLNKAEFHGSEFMVYGKDEEWVYIGEKYYVIRIPKRFFILDEQALMRVYIKALRTGNLGTTFATANTEATTPVVDTGTQERSKDGKFMLSVFKTTDENPVEYRINPKFMAEIKDFPYGDCKSSGKPNTPLIFNMFGEPCALVLPVRTN